MSTSFAKSLRTLSHVTFAILLTFHLVLPGSALASTTNPTPGEHIIKIAQCEGANCGEAEDEEDDTTTNTNASGLNCEDQGLHEENGICLPDNPYKGSSGIAGKTTIGDILKIVINILLTLAGVIAVLFIIIGGFQYMTSRGNEEQATKGRKTFIYAIIGLVAVLLSYTIVQIVYNTIVKNNVFS